MKIKLNPYLRDFWETKSQIKILYGGRASSKTEDTAGFLTYIALKYKVKIACIRKFQANIKQSVYSVIKKKVTNDDRFKKHYYFTERSITTSTNSEFIFLGWDRNTEQIKGLDDIDIVWIEEGETLTKEQWKIIEPTILLRKETSMIIIVFNPKLETDFVYKHFIKNKVSDAIIKKINYDNNPFIPKKALVTINKKKLELEDDDFNHIYLGYPEAEGNDVFIKRSWIEACIDAHIKLNIDVRGHKYIGYDISDGGKDSCATVNRYGILTTEIKEWQAKEDELEDSHTKVFYDAVSCNASINYDCIGVGAGAGSRFKNINKENNLSIIYNKFDAGAKVQNPDYEYMPKRKNKDHFENLKSQSWQNIADRIKITYNAVIKGTTFNEDDIISISSEVKYLDNLVLELSTPKRDTSKRGLVKVESKEDLLKRGIKSPNIADAFIMGYYNCNERVLRFSV